MRLEIKQYLQQQIEEARMRDENRQKRARWMELMYCLVFLACCFLPWGILGIVNGILCLMQWGHINSIIVSLIQLNRIQQRNAYRWVFITAFVIGGLLHIFAVIFLSVLWDLGRIYTDYIDSGYHKYLYDDFVRLYYLWMDLHISISLTLSLTHNQKGLLQKLALDV